MPLRGRPLQRLADRGDILARAVARQTQHVASIVIRDEQILTAIAVDVDP